jgi:hypothetical protein
MEAVDKIKAKLLEKYKLPAQVDLVNTSILYMQKKITEKKKDDSGKWVLSYNFDPGWLLQSIAECIDNGFALDGVNYVITGNRMYMPTYHAFKNKIYMVYPDTVFDLQLVREGDEFTVSKESGAVLYQHNIADPFTSTESKIKGAYCVIKNSRGEFLETLNSTDFEKMRNSSKNPALWGKWLSEFWLKSVIKRACKRHFHDITKAIDEKDNEVVGIDDMVKASDDKKAAIVAAKKPKKEASNGSKNPRAKAKQS